MLDEAVKERFEKFVMPEPNSGCWIWVGGLRQGRAVFALEGRDRTAARIAYRIYKSDDLGALHVCHKCDNPLCVNPDHLWLGTHADNMKDMSVKKRSACQQHPERYRAILKRAGHSVKRRFKGSEHARAKLDEAKVKDIILLAASGVPRSALSNRFSVSTSTVGLILTRKIWRHVHAEMDRGGAV